MSASTSWTLSSSHARLNTSLESLENIQFKLASSTVSIPIPASGKALAEATFCSAVVDAVQMDRDTQHDNVRCCRLVTPDHHPQSVYNKTAKKWTKTNRACDQSIIVRANHWRKALLHIWHAKGLAPLWVSLWQTKLLHSPKDLSHSQHLKGSTAVSNSWWTIYFLTAKQDVIGLLH